MSEVFDNFNHRCCMCPNKEKPSAICPGIKGTAHPDPEPCRFVKSYRDGESRLVVISLAPPGEKPEWAILRIWPTPDGSEVCLPLLVGLTSFDQSQKSLNALAHERDWPAIEEQSCRVCGCTHDRACPSGCYWVEEDLCSRCSEAK